MSPAGAMIPEVKTNGDSWMCMGKDVGYAGLYL